MDELADDDGVVYAVVLNDEEQYSIWPAERDLPAGWHQEGTVGTKAECLRAIEELWTDMRPRSVREALSGAEASGREAGGAEATTAP